MEDKIQFKSAVKWFKRKNELAREIKVKKQILELWRDAATRATPVYGKTGTCGGGTPESMLERFSILIADEHIEEKLEDMISKMEEAQEEIQEVIDRVSSAECRLLLTERYCIGKKWAEIADDMGYAEEYLRGHLHRKSIRAAIPYIRIEN